MDVSQVLLFMMASFIVIITPGQDLLLVMSSAVSQGSRAGVITASGVSTGLLGHSLLTTVGLGALLFASASLFTIIKVVGAVYLFYLGVRMIMSNGFSLSLNDAPRTAGRRLFFAGAFSNISNPHITIFYFAFLPQFIPDTTDNPAPLLFLLGVGFALLTFLIKASLGYFAGTLSCWIRTHPTILQIVEKTSGLLLIGLGIKLALVSRN